MLVNEVGASGAADDEDYDGDGDDDDNGTWLENGTSSTEGVRRRGKRCVINVWLRIQ